MSRGLVNICANVCAKYEIDTYIIPDELKSEVESIQSANRHMSQKQWMLVTKQLEQHFSQMEKNLRDIIDFRCFFFDSQDLAIDKSDLGLSEYVFIFQKRLMLIHSHLLFRKY